MWGLTRTLIQSAIHYLAGVVGLLLLFADPRLCAAMWQAAIVEWCTQTRGAALVCLTKQHAASGCALAIENRLRII